MTDVQLVKRKVTRYGLLINDKKYFLPELVLQHLGEIVKVFIHEGVADIYYSGKIIDSFDL